MLRSDVSIIVTSYNKPQEQVMECMQSIRDQTVPPREVILVDDASETPTAHALATTIILPRNVGVARARDIGAKFSKGKLLLFLDADDKLAPDFIQQCGLVVERYEIAYPSVLMFGNIERNELYEPPESIKPIYLMGHSNGVLVTSMMHRRVYESLGGFRELPVFEDWDFWLRAMSKGYTFHKANTLLYYRQNQKSRNVASKDLKSEVLRSIQAPYEVVNGKLTERKPNG